MTPKHLPAGQEVIEHSHTDRQGTMLVRTQDPIWDPAWTVTPVTLDDLVIAYMRDTSSSNAQPAPSRPPLEALQ